MNTEYKRSKKGYLSPGDKVLMKDGEILTVVSLEYRDFVAIEKSEYVPKSKIECVVETAMLDTKE